MLPGNQTITELAASLASYCGSVAIIIKDPASNGYIQLYGGNIPEVLGVIEIMKTKMVEFWNDKQPKIATLGR